VEPVNFLVYRIVTEERSLAPNKRVSPSLEKRFRVLNYRIASVESGAAFAVLIGDVLRILVIVLVAVALPSAPVGSNGPTGTMGTFVLKRTCEIGVLGGALSLPTTSRPSNVIGLSIFNSPV
jgi:hypothetical protein